MTGSCGKQLKRKGKKMKTFKVEALIKEFPFLTNIAQKYYLFSEALEIGNVKVKVIDKLILTKKIDSKQFTDTSVQPYDPQYWEIGTIIVRYNERLNTIITVNEESFIEEIYKKKLNNIEYLILFEYRYTGGVGGREGDTYDLITIYKNRDFDFDFLIDKLKSKAETELKATSK